MSKPAAVVPPRWTGRNGVVFDFERVHTHNAAASYGLVARVSADPKGLGRRHVWGKSLRVLIKRESGGKMTLIEWLRRAECSAGYHIRGKCKIDCQP